VLLAAAMKSWFDESSMFFWTVNFFPEALPDVAPPVEPPMLVVFSMPQSQLSTLIGVPFSRAGDAIDPAPATGVLLPIAALRLLLSLDPMQPAATTATSASKTNIPNRFIGPLSSLLIALVHKGA
jgi:hypothetical protein